MNRRALLAVCALLGGCNNPRTEALVVISSSGITVPTDVDAVRIQVSDRTTGDTLFDEAVLLCHDGLTAACKPLPMRLVLRPGDMRPSDRVFVEVDALSKSQPVITNSVLFTFIPGQSLRLDLVLYKNCLGNLTCGMRDQTCGPDASCMTVQAIPFQSDNQVDLSVPVQDSAMPMDMASVSPDLKSSDMASSSPGDMVTTGLPDLASPSDLMSTGFPDFSSGGTDGMCSCAGRMCGPDSCGHASCPPGCGFMEYCAGGQCFSVVTPDM